MFFFFFKQKTAYEMRISDWSSDVCSSDLTQSVIGARSLSSRPDHVSMSPSGRYCVISGGDVSDATVAWNRTFTSSRVVHHSGEHSDLALGPDGSDYYVEEIGSASGRERVCQYV